VTSLTSTDILDL